MLWRCARGCTNIHSDSNTNIGPRRRRQSYFVASRTQTLTADNYDSLVQGEQVWVIMVWREFNCERCIQVSDAWEEAAKQMSGIVNFGRINFDRQAALCESRPCSFPSPAHFQIQFISPDNWLIGWHCVCGTRRLARSWTSRSASLSHTATTDIHSHQ